MVITQQQIRRAVPEVGSKHIDSFVASFNMYAVHFGINTPLRIAHFLCQTIWESNYLKSVEENLNYSAQGLLKTFPRYFTEETAKEYAHQPLRIANRVYAGRMGNGNEASGDGYKYKGRGFIMLTGKENYQKFNKYDLCTEDVVNHPEEVAEFPLNQLAAMFFWEANNLNALADRDDCQAITRKINGGLNGLSNRQFLLRRFKKEFGIKAI